MVSGWDNVNRDEHDERRGELDRGERQKSRVISCNCKYEYASTQVHSNSMEHVNLVTTSTSSHALPQPQVYDIRWWESPGPQITIHSSRSRTSTECGVKRCVRHCLRAPRKLFSTDPEATLLPCQLNARASSLRKGDQGSIMIRGNSLSRYDQSVWRIPSVYLDDHIDPFAKEGERADISES